MSNFEGMTLFVDYNKCIGCESCEAVCKFLYSHPRIVMMRSSTGIVRPLYCMHCDSAFCMKACKQGALTRDADGAVLLDPMRCRGCTSMNCLIACPYAAFFSTGKGVRVDKCDLCKARRKKNMPPACMEMCPCGAMLNIAVFSKRCNPHFAPCGARDLPRKARLPIKGDHS